MWKKRYEKLNTIEEIVLKNLNINSVNELNEWFLKSSTNNYWIKDLEKAVEIVKKSSKTRPIKICGDYDVDGVISMYILCDALRKCGFTNINYRAPYRHTEGFGFNLNMIAEITEPDALVITCDNGVSAIEAIKTAKEKGMEVIILDHHEATVKEGVKILPDADVIIDPNAIPDSADFNGYCGAGICYKFAKMLIGDDDPVLMGAAAIGTIADCMELTQENYVFVRKGLKYISDGYVSKGLAALLKLFNLEVVTASDIGYRIGPALNAMGRLYNTGAMTSTELLLCNNTSTAKMLAQQCYDANELRKALVKKAETFAYDVLNGPVPLPVVIYIPELNEGIIGIIAGRITEKYKVPCIVLTDIEEKPDLLKGSGRAPKGFNLKKLLDEVGNYFIKFGGHAGAAGVTISKENLVEMKEKIIEKAKEFDFKPDNNVVKYYDIEIKPEEVADNLEELKKYAPFGMGNPELVFKISDVPIIPYQGKYKKTMNKDGIKLSSKDFDMLGFEMSQRFDKYEKPIKMDFLATLSESVYMGNNKVQLMYEDFDNVKVLKEEKTVTPFAQRLKQLAANR